MASATGFPIGAAVRFGRPPPRGFLQKCQLPADPFCASTDGGCIATLAERIALNRPNAVQPAACMSCSSRIRRSSPSTRRACCSTSARRACSPSLRSDAALAWLATAKPDVGVLDVSSRAARRRSRSPMSCSSARVPFMFTTGYGDSALIPARFRDVPIVRKPYTLHALADAVAKCCASVASSA